MQLSSCCTYHVEADDLTVGLLDLLKLGEEVPEARLGNNCVGSKDAHAVQLGGRVCLGGQVAPDDLVLDETAYYLSVSVIECRFVPRKKAQQLDSRLSGCRRSCM